MTVGMYEHFTRSVSWLRLFVTELSPWRPTFDPRSVHVFPFFFFGGRLEMGHAFSPSISVFALSGSFHECSTHRC